MNTENPIAILLELQKAEQLFHSHEVFLGRRRWLNAEVEDYIVEQAKFLSRRKPIHIVVQLSAEGTNKRSYHHGYT